jgi:hypothetical protein
LKGNLRKKRKANVQLRRQKLGVLLISLVQKVSFATHKHHNVVCQVNRNPLVGALHFYLRLWFRIYPKNDFVNQLQNNNSDVVSVDPGLIWVGSRCPLYLVYPFLLEDRTDPDSMQIAVKAGLEHILKIKKEDKREWGNAIVNVLGIENFKEEIVLDDRYIINDERNNKISVTFEGLSVILKKRNPNITMQPINDKGPQNRKHFNNNHNYMVMSEMVFGTTDHHNDIRCFISYILFCIQTMQAKGNLLFQDDKYKQFSKDCIEACLRLKNLVSEAPCQDMKL